MTGKTEIENIPTPDYKDLQIFRGEFLYHSHIVNHSHINLEEIEREAIMRFLKDLPLDKLKKLVNFKEINPSKIELWNDYDLQDELKRLKFEGLVKIKTHLKL